MQLPEPANWQEFELITKDAMQLKWSSPDLHRNGSAGQEQHGVDIYGPDQLGRPVGIQCKNTVGKLSYKKVKSEVENAEKFEGPLQALYIATTAKMDAALQKDVRLLSEERVKVEKFAVGLLYWEDIFAGLALDPQVLSNHYPNLVIGGSATKGSPGADRLSGLVLGYYGRYFWHFIELLFGEAGWMAQENPEQLRTIVRMLKVNSRVLSQDDASDVQRWCVTVERLVFNPPAGLSGDDKWAEVKQTALSVEQRAKYLSSLVDDVGVGNFIELGISLGRIYHSEGDLTRKNASSLHRMIAALLPSAEGLLIELLKTLDGKPTYRAGPALYSLIDQELRFPTQGLPS